MQYHLIISLKFQCYILSYKFLCYKIIIFEFYQMYTYLKYDKNFGDN